MSSLVVNLAFVGQKPTGLATYAINLIPHLDRSNLTQYFSDTTLTFGDPPASGTSLNKGGRGDQVLTQRYCNLTLLASASFLPRLPAGTTYQEVPANLTYEQGKLGHFRRMAWTQFQLPRLCDQLQAELLFSPVPEIPIGLNCGAIVMVHDVIPLRFPRLTSPLTHYFRYYVPQVLRQARHILCNSEATAKDIVDFYQIPAQKITPIPLAHDANHFRPVPEVAASAEQRPYFFYVGRHDPYKNLHRLIAAFAALPSHQDYELWIAGSADPRFTPALQAQVAELGLTSQVKFLDYVTYDQLPLLLSRSIAMVYPSLWEGFGFPVLEAMACGTPVITSNLSSLPEVVGDAAILVDPRQTDELTQAMRQIVTDAPLRSQLRSAGLVRASQFSWVKTGEATAAVLRQFSAATSLPSDRG